MANKKQENLLGISGKEGFPGGSAGKESAFNVGDGFSPWVGKIPWRRESLPTPVFWPGELHRQSRGSQSWTPLSDFPCIFCILEYSELDYILTFTNLLYLLSYDD